MVQRTLNLELGTTGVVVGTLRFESQGNREFSSFTYSDQWQEYPRKFAIAPSMPLEGAQFFFRKGQNENGIPPFPPPLADTMPDSFGRTVIRRNFRDYEQVTRKLNEMDYLLSVDDFSRMGALRLRDADTDGPFLASQPDGHHEVPLLLSLEDLGKDIASLERHEPIKAAGMRRVVAGSGSLGGARPKCSVIDEDGSLLLAKFTSQFDTSDVETAEVTALHLARLCGLDVPDARLTVCNGRPTALLKRFDRTAAGGRRPFISAMTMLEAENAVSGTYTQLGEAIRTHAKDPKKELHELFRRVSYTILISNVDDHLKNHAFLYAGDRQWRLSPLFDVNPSPERHKELKTAISEETGSEASIEALLDHGIYFDLEEDEASAIVRDMAVTISENWRQIAESLGMHPAMIKEYAPAFQHREMDVALALGQSHSPGNGLAP